MNKDIFPSICQAIGDGQVAELKRLLKQNPEYTTQSPECARVLNNAVLMQNVEMVKMLVGLGLDINTRIAPGRTALATTVTQDDPEMLKLLLALGADPTVDSEQSLLPVNASVGSKKHSLVMLKHLHEHGCDLNQVFCDNGDSCKNALSMAMTYGKDDVVAFLKSIGCTLPEGIQEPK